MTTARPKLYVTYTPTDLGRHGLEARRIAEEGGWTVEDGAECGSDSNARLNLMGQCDAVLLLSAYIYGSDGHAEAGKAIQELEWETAQKAGKPARALLVDPNKAWHPRLIEALGNPEAGLVLESFHKKLKEHGFPKYFDLDPASVCISVSEQLADLNHELSEKGPIKVFVVWDMTIPGLGLILTSLKKRPPDGFQIEVPGLEGEGASGEIFRNIVLPGIEHSHKVLVVTDRPNANVTFEAGLALGFGKPISLIHFGSDIPNWLKDSALKGFIIRAVREVGEIRTLLRDDAAWYKPAPTSPIPPHGETLCLSPSRYVGKTLMEEQGELFPYWKNVPDSFNLNDLHTMFSGVAQVVWSITSFSEGTDERDGAENAGNGIVFGWFYARAHRDFADSATNRLCVLRQDGARSVVDLQVIEKRFQRIDEYLGHLRKISDYVLPEPRRDLKKCRFGPSDYEMVCVPPYPGNGDPASLEQPRLWVGVYQVTNHEYKRFCDTTGHRTPHYWQREFDPEQPVVEVSLEDAKEFCIWAEFELPHSGIWEHFARAGSSDPYWWGSDESVVWKVAWCRENSNGRRQRVGQKSANPWGIHDVLGNVWEWMQPFEEPESGLYSGQERVARKAMVYGGAYDKTARELNFSSNRILAPRHKDGLTGFRCVRFEKR